MTTSETERALTWARQVAGAASPDETLRAAMEALKSVLGMAVCVANLLVAADDEYEVGFVSNAENLPMDSLLGSRYAQETFESVIGGQYERAPAVHLIPPDAPEWAEFSGAEVIPDIQPRPDSDNPWYPGQELFVSLRDRQNDVLAILSLDAPHDRELPSQEKLVLAALVAQHAATTLEARVAEQASAKGVRDAEALADIVGTLEGGLSEEQLLQRAVEGIAAVCGYHTVAIHLMTSTSAREPRWSRPDGPQGSDERPWTDELDTRLLIPERQISKSYLLSYDDLARAGWALEHAVLAGGRGRRGWHRCVLAIPIDLPSKQRLGVAILDNPLDRLLPTTKRVRQLEAFATQIALMVESGRSLEHARVQAEIDSLTGLANREGLYAGIQRALDADKQVSVLFLDLNRFKRVNDSYGHSVGDELLRHVARRLERAVRARSLVGRLAGDEFVIAFFGSEVARISSVTVRVLAALGEPYALSCGTVSLDASAGVATSTPGATVDRLIHEADLDMYRAKAAAAQRT